jgi:DNA adenine methylase
MIFRYPGGKGKLVKKFIQWIPASIPQFADLFVGGGSVALAVAARKNNENTKIYLNDNDRWISSFWSVTIGNEKDFQTLLSEIRQATITLEEFKKRRLKFAPQDFTKRADGNSVDAAFNALFFNRTTFSGILSSGPIGGEDQETANWKIDARWNEKRLIKEITAARKLLLGRTEVTNQDFSDAIRGLPTQCFIYADPPYYRKGSTLYGSAFESKKHTELFDVLQSRGNWLLSYDICPEIKKMYEGYRQESLGKQYRSMGASERPEDESELIIFSKEEKMNRFSHAIPPFTVGKWRQLPLRDLP